MENSIKKSSWFDAALSDAVSDFAKEMGCKPASRNQSPGNVMDNGNKSQRFKITARSKKNAERIYEI